MLEEGAGENVTHLGEVLFDVGFGDPLSFLGDVLFVEDQLVVLHFQGLRFGEKFLGNVFELLEVFLLESEGIADLMFFTVGVLGGLSEHHGDEFHHVFEGFDSDLWVLLFERSLHFHISLEESSVSHVFLVEASSNDLWVELSNLTSIKES